MERVRLWTKRSLPVRPLCLAGAHPPYTPGCTTTLTSPRCTPQHHQNAHPTITMIHLLVCEFTPPPLKRTTTYPRPNPPHPQNYFENQLQTLSASYDCISSAVDPILREQVSPLLLTKRQQVLSQEVTK